MKQRVLVVATVLVAVLAMGGCAAQSGSSSSNSDSGSSTQSSSSAQQASIPSKSILLFDNNQESAKLVKNMQEGITPTECTALYDEGGSLPSITVTDQNTIREIYDLLASVTVVDETNVSVTDRYHMVSFVLQDKSNVGFAFEDDDLLVCDNKRYTVEGSGPLWAYVRRLQAQETGGKNAYAIQVQDEAGVVLECPTSAEEGSWVDVLCSTESTDNIHVYANGEEVTRSDEIYIYTNIGSSEEKKTPAHKRKFQFYMPSSDVELKVTAES